jgi:hypothetical protein
MQEKFSRIFLLFLTLVLWPVSGVIAQSSISAGCSQCSSFEANATIPTTTSLSLVPRKTIPYRALGTNAFVNDSRFGTIRRQFAEVKNTIRLREVRLLFRWDDNVQPSPDSPPSFVFYDDIVRAIPSGVRAIVVLTGVPTWMRDSRHWIAGNPRATFIERWVKPVLNRYRTRRSIRGWQIWNEPNAVSDPENVLLGLPDSPAQYLEMLALGYQAVKTAAPQDLVISAATTAINQNFPRSFQYNQEMRELGAETVCDVFAVHYYGSQYENVLFFGIGDFLKASNRPIWVTESGARGTNRQLEYGERTWPFLLSVTPRIQRIYQYQFTDSTPADETWGMRNLTLGRSVSDLYLHLRSR